MTLTAAGVSKTSFSVRVAVITTSPRDLARRREESARAAESRAVGDWAADTVAIVALARKGQTTASDHGRADMRSINSLACFDSWSERAPLCCGVSVVRYRTGSALLPYDSFASLGIRHGTEWNLGTNTERVRNRGQSLAHGFIRATDVDLFRIAMLRR